jgi:hypothetical protein
MLWIVKNVPQFRCDEKFFALDNALGYFSGDSVTDFILVAVDKGTVNVTVTGIDSVLYRLLNLTNWRLKKIK